MSETSPIRVAYFEKTALIQFIRPDLKNSLSVKTIRVLRKQFNKLDSDKSIDNILFTGTGNTFAAGANLNEVKKLNPETALEFGLRGQNLMRSIYKSSKQTVAFINGFCMGGALDLALSCRKRIGTKNSVFAHPGAKLGIITGWSGTQLLPRLIGKKKALEILLLAKRIDSNEAFKIGLIDEVSDNSLAKVIESL